METRTASMGFVFEVFIFLQLLDFLTTITGLKLGAQELNPFILKMMSMGDLEGLLCAKLAIVLMGLAVMWYRRIRVIVAVNYIFAAIVVWNLTQLTRLTG